MTDTDNTLTLHGKDVEEYWKMKNDSRIGKCRTIARQMTHNIMADKQPHSLGDVTSAIVAALQAKKHFTASERPHYEKDLRVHAVGITLNTSKDKTNKLHRRYIANQKAVYQMLDYASQEAHDKEASRLSKLLTKGGKMVDDYIVRYAKWHKGQTPPALRSFAQGLGTATPTPANDAPKKRKRRGDDDQPVAA